MSHWIEKSNIYHIYPLGFCGCERFRADAKELDRGRILKVIEWIPHLKSLNMNAVYFGPVLNHLSMAMIQLIITPLTNVLVLMRNSAKFVMNFTRMVFVLFLTVFSIMSEEIILRLRIYSKMVRIHVSRIGSPA